MGFLKVLTIILIVLKAIGLISCSWWLVFLPVILEAVFYVLVVLITFIATIIGMK